MNFLIISGTSGSGKTIALQVLEDLGYYCIDNLPASLMGDLITRLQSTGNIRNCAISIDARNRQFLTQLKTHFQSLTEMGMDYRLLFLDASDQCLLKRYSETRRKHPLSSEQVSLREAIGKERETLEYLSEIAHRHIDTSNKTPHELRSVIKNFAATTGTHALTLLFQSFGFKYGAPSDADFIFDVRCLPNPHWDPELQPLTGLDNKVQAFFSKHSICEEMYLDIRDFIDKWLDKFIDDNRNYITVAIGCTGGKHRSVYLCDALIQHFKHSKDIQAQIRHRELSNF